MVEETIVLCDVCKERVAKAKCNLCGKDICKYRACVREFPINFGGKVDNYGHMFAKGAVINILYCRDCWDKKIKGLVSRKDFWDEAFVEKTAKSVADCIRKRLIIESLEGKKD